MQVRLFVTDRWGQTEDLLSNCSSRRGSCKVEKCNG